MNIKLYEHNEVAYQKLKEHLKHNQLGSIDHATGTGKSFIALKYLYDNKDKRILYLTPTYYIFNQLRDSHMPKLGININEFHKFDNKIYANLSKYDLEKMASDYDIIILDEYHRCGAKIWGKSIKELKKILLEKYPDKKIIGLTATPIRYLDNERDMNDEIFFGNSVSTLTLGDAIIKGLLQPPTYINTADSYLNYLEDVKNKIRKKFVYEDDEYYTEYQQMLNKAIKHIQEKIEFKVSDIHLPRENGKYIVFCSTISDIKKNKSIIQEKFKDINMSFYTVHSGQTKLKNEEELRKFSNNNDSSNFIFVVDLLNEGIHVDNIDGIFLMRKTKSPIIYFQQLGRLLSYSTKQKQLVVWDMVDNIKNHNVIYKLYQDVISRTKKLVIEDSKNKQIYEQILSNFKIIDNYTEIMSEIRNIEELVDSISEEELLKIRVSHFINILSNPFKSNSTLSKSKQVSQLFKANQDLYKYYKHITLEQFIKIRNRNIKLPKEIDISVEEFKSKLSGYNTLYEKENAEYSELFNVFKKFVINKNSLPSILSKDIDEQKFAYVIYNTISKCNKELKKMYLFVIKNLSNVTIFDKCYYLGVCEKTDYDMFFKSLDYCLENEIEVNKHIYKLFEKLYNNSLIKEKYQLNKYIGKLKYKYDVNGITKHSYIENKYDIEKDSYLIKLNKLKEFGLETIDINEVKKFVLNYVYELIQFIKLKGRYPNVTDKENKKYLALKPFIYEFGYQSELDNVVNKYITENNIEVLIDKIIDFMEKNNGDFPSDRVLDEEEKRFAQKVKKYSAKLQFYKLRFEELQKNIRSNNNDNWFVEYVKFILEKKRYPIIQSDDIYEKELEIRYIRNENRLSKEQNNELKNIKRNIGETELIRNTFIERQKVRSVSNGTKR